MYIHYLLILLVFVYISGKDLLLRFPNPTGFYLFLPFIFL
ncbi:hypothetical protein DET1302 [Dehalococcoides mccartyi 195]|uniref:Uncharacterized protein n=1 Tax=Dehalococcoides mccartyi (strain ATCC BAA-2266 / KCTC 15142 / 195) TaxID=243164 RepID=Q3Z6Y5_DEHM1|nr:hypothetical protein DET1302 [Dehalococcoides mccartyi 195]POZ59716.1 hypothetical protein C1O63_0259 [Dehalococcoides mccartyi]